MAEPGAFVQQLGGSALAATESSSRTLVNGDTIYLGETVETGARASLTLATAVGGAHVLVSADSRLAFESPSEIRALHGRIDVTAPANGMLLSIVTPQGQMVARGTGVALSVDSEGTEVHVTQGAALIKRLRGGAFEKLELGARLRLPAEHDAVARRDER